jgi:hypothetical protein
MQTTIQILPDFLHFLNHVNFMFNMALWFLIGLLVNFLHSFLRVFLGLQESLSKITKFLEYAAYSSAN